MNRFDTLCSDHQEFAVFKPLFSVLIALDDSLCPVAWSPTLERHMPLLRDDCSLFDQFRFQRPASVKTVEDVHRNLGSLFLMIDHELTFAIRGQIIKHEGTPGIEYVFCGAPWMFWLSNNRPDLKLGLQDFSAQDAQVDQLFYINTESRMVEDLERLNAELTRAKAETEEAQASRDRFFARMSHEMRTPLNGVISAITLMQDPKHRHEFDDMLRMAGQSATNLLQVINYVLDVSRLDSKEGALEPVPFNITDLLESVLDVVRARAMEKSLTLDYACANGIPSDYVGDANLLRQILLNLSMNAIKFTDEGGVTISVEPSERPEYRLRIEVRDTGMGIRKEVQKTIFEPFSTLHANSPGTMGEGTGLGLDIVRRNTKVLGGVIGVASAPGAGSTFWLEVPLEVSDTADVIDDTPVRRETGSTDIFALDGKVLLVDDNTTNLMLGAMLIESMGLHVDQANGGQTAIDMALNGDYDVVLMDISMPDIDGYEATKAIRAALPTDTLPILALTAHASQVERDKSAAAGMNGYLTKPIERDKLFGALAGILTKAPDIEESIKPPQPTVNLLDELILVTLRDNIGFDYLQRVSQKLLDEAPTRFDALIGCDQSQEVALQAHALAGMCSSFGLLALTETLKNIEIEARDDTCPSSEQYDHLEHLRKESFQALRTWLDRPE